MLENWRHLQHRVQEVCQERDQGRLLGGVRLLFTLPRQAALQCLQEEPAGQRPREARPGLPPRGGGGDGRGRLRDEDGPDPQTTADTPVSGRTITGALSEGHQGWGQDQAVKQQV